MPCGLARRWTALSTVLKRSLNVRPSLVEPKAAIVGSREEDCIAALDSLPDDVLGLIIVACGDGHLFMPELGSVSGLNCCKSVLKQLHRLRPLVCMQIRSLSVAQRLTHITCSPWRIVLAYTGELTAAAVEEAARGRVRSINMRNRTLLPAVAERVVPELLGAGCSLLDLKLEGVRLDSSWVEVFGEAAVCSEVLTELQIDGCRLRGPLPELKLPALQSLFMYRNQLTGDLKPLLGCIKALQVSGLGVPQHNTPVRTRIRQASSGR